MHYNPSEYPRSLQCVLLVGAMASAGFGPTFFSQDDPIPVHHAAAAMHNLARPGLPVSIAITPKIGAAWAAEPIAGPPEPVSIEAISTAVFSPDGNYVLAGFNPRVLGARKYREEGNILRLWNVKSGAQVWHFAGHQLGTSFVAFLPDGKQAISSGFDGMVRLWNVEHGKEIRSFRAYTGPTAHAALSPDGTKLLASGTDPTQQAADWPKLKLFDVAAGKLRAVYDPYDNPLRSVRFSSDGKFALIACQPYLKNGQLDPTNLRIWDIAKGRPRFSFAWHGPVDTPVPERQWTWPATISPDGSLVLAHTIDPQSEAHFLDLLDVRTGKQVGYMRIPYTKHTAWLEFTPDSTKIIAIIFSEQSRSLVYKVYDIVGRKVILAKDLPPGPASSITTFVLSPNGQQAFVAFGWQMDGKDMRVEIWDAMKGEVIQSLSPPR